MKTLLADIGGTYSRFAWQEGDLFSPPIRFANKDFDSFEAVIDFFLKNQTNKLKTTYSYDSWSFLLIF